jgi:hypothetical protein
MRRTPSRHIRHRSSQDASSFSQNEPDHDTRAWRMSSGIFAAKKKRALLFVAIKSDWRRDHSEFVTDRWIVLRSLVRRQVFLLHRSKPIFKHRRNHDEA